VTGDYSQGNAGTLRLVVSPSGTDDKLAVDGRATLGGTLVVEVAGSGAGSAKVVTARTRVGTFGSVEVAAPPGVTPSVSYQAKSVTVAMAAAPSSPAPQAPSAPATPTGGTGQVPTAGDSGTTGSTGSTGSTGNAGGRTGGTTGTSGTSGGGGGSRTDETTGTELAGKAVQGPGILFAATGTVAAPTSSATPSVAVVAEGPGLIGKGVAAWSGSSDGSSATELADAVLALLVPVLPDLPFADDRAETNAALASLLVGGRTRTALSGRRGSVAATATVVEGGGADAPQREALADAALARLLLDPKGQVGGWSDSASSTDSYSAPEEEEAEEPARLGGLAAGAFGLLGGAAALVAWAARTKQDDRRRQRA
ncbi:MAG: hypothetical protein K2W96_22510, partial [Gemmataceae bacterium]|nr:hypothetical protein [Gemmataceae bacterium]